MLSEKIAALQSSSRPQLNGSEIQLLQDKLAMLERSLSRLRDDERRRILSTGVGGARCVLSTLSSSALIFSIAAQSHGEATAAPSSSSLLFDTLIVDEAAQCMEPECLIPLCYGNMATSGWRRMVLMGDPLQLPATLLDRQADQSGLSMSLMERLMATPAFQNEVIMLTVQYRMAACIRQFPSRMFYADRLLDHDDPPVREHVLGGLWFYDVSEGYDETAVSAGGGGRPRAHQRHGTVSLLNRWEAEACVILVRRILSVTSGGGGGSTIGVITPYKEQTKLIRQLLHLQPQHSATFAAAAAAAAVESAVEVNTVDAFQGREKNVIVLSAVRSNKAGDLGFLKDARRLNVALTRAKNMLVIVGNADTLRQRAGVWRKLVDHCESVGCLRRFPSDLISTTTAAAAVAATATATTATAAYHHHHHHRQQQERYHWHNRQGSTDLLFR